MRLAPGRPKPVEVPLGDRLRYSAGEGRTEVPLGDRPRYSADEGLT